MSENKTSVDCMHVKPAGRWRIRFGRKGRDGVFDDVVDLHSGEAVSRRASEFLNAGARYVSHGEYYRLPDGRELRGHELPPGCFQWEKPDPASAPRFLYIVLPGGSGSFDAIQVQHGGPGGPRVWGWDGNVEKPTLQPSIHWVGVWHGFLENGRLRSCP